VATCTFANVTLWGGETRGTTNTVRVYFSQLRQENVQNRHTEVCTGRKYCIWQFAVGSDMPPGVTPELFLLYLTMLWARLKFAVSNYRTISESWREKDSEVSTWMDWLSKNKNISLSSQCRVWDSNWTQFTVVITWTRDHGQSTSLLEPQTFTKSTCQSDGLLERNKQRSLTFQIQNYFIYQL